MIARLRRFVTSLRAFSASLSAMYRTLDEHQGGRAVTTELDPSTLRSVREEWLTLCNDQDLEMHEVIDQFDAWIANNTRTEPGQETK